MHCTKMGSCKIMLICHCKIALLDTDKHVCSSLSQIQTGSIVTIQVPCGSDLPDKEDVWILD